MLMEIDNERSRLAGGPIMTTYRVSADIKDDRRVVLTLPPEVPIGRTN